MPRRRRRKAPSSEIVEVTVESLSHEGRGVAHVDGKVVFIDGALAGERVRFRYTAHQRRFDEGATVEVLEPSPLRVEPRCPHFEICGGCSLQHMAPQAQVELKQATLLEQFAHMGEGLAPREIAPPITCEPWGYRRKARLGAKYVTKKEAVLVGFREKRSSFIADITRCDVLHPSVGERITALRELIGSMEARQRLPQIEVAVGEEGTALVFRHLDPLSEEDRRRLTEFGQRHDFQIHLQPKGPDTVHALWPGEASLHYLLPEFELEMGFRPGDFTQVNDEINRKMIHQALEWLDPQPGERVLDLFCGLGNFTLPLARRAGHVVGVEGEAALVERGRENAVRNGIGNVEFHGADLTQPPESHPWYGEGFDKILLDPPRSGAAGIVDHLHRFGAGRIVYVSCNPATLARDAAVLVANGYRLEKAGIMDMFPHTAHVESMALFERS